MHVRRACAGHDQSFAWVVERFTPLLRAQAELRLRGGLAGECDAEDLLQDVWAVVYLRLSHLEPRNGRLTPVLARFLASTLSNRVANLLRRQIRRERLGHAAAIDYGEPSALRQIPDATAGVITRVVRNEQADLVTEALAALDRVDRDLIVLRAFEQQSYADIARLLGCPASPLRMRHARALARLRSCLPDSLFDEFDEA